MASIQQLEKLHHIQKIFQHDRSLESVVAFQRVQAATQRTEQVKYILYRIIPHFIINFSNDTTSPTLVQLLADKAAGFSA
jgi:hypothetical protein